MKKYPTFFIFNRIFIIFFTKYSWESVVLLYAKNFVSKRLYHGQKMAFNHLGSLKKTNVIGQIFCFNDKDKSASIKVS